ncbi:leucine-rich repeat domain-containing protein [Nonomuraea sp. NPDC049649]|uniref:leucine-rich repeat domain-containing protein n=1 Tax=Nonomuraea sp. NPDC049649 TaxID=3155776 RepID=UPI003442322D
MSTRDPGPSGEPPPPAAPDPSGGVAEVRAPGAGLTRFPGAAPSGARLIDLAWNELTELPAWTGDLSELEELRLDGNRLRALPDLSPPPRTPPERQPADHPAPVRRRAGRLARAGPARSRRPRLRHPAVNPPREPRVSPHMTTFPRLPAFALLAGLLVACSPGGGDSSYVAAGQKQEQLPALTVEQLADKVGCAPRIQVDAADIRTGYCKTEDGEFFVSTFATEEGKDAWMDQAPEYKPHLVGPKWTVLGDLEVLEALQVPLDGDLHLSDHRVSQSPAPGKEAGSGY